MERGAAPPGPASVGPTPPALREPRRAPRGGCSRMGGGGWRAGGPSGSSQDAGTWRGEGGRRTEVTVTVRYSVWGKGGQAEK